MPYIGKNPVGGGFHKLDALTASATATYALTLNSAAYFPESANQLLVSLNGVIQAPQDSFTVSGSNLVFDTALTASDSIDFVVALGDVLAVQTVTDGAITTAKLGNGAVTSAKLDTNIAVSGNLDVGTIRDAAGTNTAMTIDSSGSIAMDNTYSMLRLSLLSDVTSNTTITDWGAPTNSKQLSTFGNNPVTHSSGIFSFAVNGVYRVSFSCRMLHAGGDSTASVAGWASYDGGSTYNESVKASEGNSSGGTSTGSITLLDFINVDNASNFKYKFLTESLASGSQIYGASGNIMFTTCIFERIANAQ